MTERYFRKAKLFRLVKQNETQKVVLLDTLIESDRSCVIENTALFSSIHIDGPNFPLTIS